MTTAIRRRRGTTTQHSTFTGLEGEVTVDTTKDTLVVHDGSTAGGHPLAKENNATLAGNVTLSGGTANGVAYLNGSKVVTTGSALVFDGTNLKVGAPSFAPNTNLAGNLLQLKSASGFAYLTMGNGDGANNTGYIGSASGLLTFGSVTDAGVTSEQMRLTSTGLGIGTSSPSNKLQVNGNLRVEGATSEILMAVGAERTISASGSASSTALTFKRWNGSTYVNDVVMDGSGNIGLGVTPSAWNASHRAIQFQYNTAISSYSSVDGLTLTSNGYASAATTWNYLETYPAAQYQVGNGQHKWYTAPSGTAGNAISFTQAMTLDSAGLLGVGISSPNVAGGTAGTVIHVHHASQAQIHLTNDTTGSTSSNGSNISVSGLDLYINNRQNGFTAFYNNGSERARIDSNGRVLINTTTADTNYRVRIDGNIASSSPLRCTMDSTSAATQVGFFNPNGAVGSISTSGTTTSYNTSSDYRLKENVQPMTGALAKVASLKPCTYNWKVDGSDGEGFIAHELAEVVPQCVTGEKDAVDADGNPVYQGIDTSFLVATLTAAIKELKAEFDAYKATHP